MNTNKDIKKVFFKNIKNELKESKEELLRASQQFTELSKTYEVLMVYKKLIDNDDMITLLGYKRPLSAISNNYKRADLENMNFMDAIHMIYEDYKPKYSKPLSSQDNEVNGGNFYGI